MKMLLAIVNYDDSRNVMSHLMKAGFSITKLASTGGFLRSGNVTILIGLEDHQVDDAFEIPPPDRAHDHRFGTGRRAPHADGSFGRRRDRVCAGRRTV